MKLYEGSKSAEKAWDSRRGGAGRGGGDSKRRCTKGEWLLLGALETA